MDGFEDWTENERKGSQCPTKRLQKRLPRNKIIRKGLKSSTNRCKNKCKNQKYKLILNER